MTDTMATELSPTMALPKDFKSIREISDMDAIFVAKQKPFVNVVGLIRDYQPPRQTGGSDWKMTLTIVDQSIEESYEVDIMKLNVFLPRPDMPVIAGVAQPVLIRSCRVQIHSGAISLITNFRTEIHVFPVQTPTDTALPPPTSKRGKVNIEEVRYVAWLQTHIQRGAFPDSREFQERVVQATNLKVKSCELKDARPGMFGDIVGEVIHMFDVSDRTTVYVTDYTSNKNFYNHVMPGVHPIFEGRDGDDFGYSNSKMIHKSKTNEWKGPYGKMSIQLTAFDEHSERFRDYVKVGNWVKLLNVHFEFPKTGGHLEAKLRTDRRAHPGKLQVEVLAPPENKEDMDYMWKNALRRKRDYQETVKKQKREFEQEIEEVTGKRKRDDDDEPVKMNGKLRRKEKRKAMQEKLQHKSKIEAGQGKPIADTPAEDKAALNTAVRCHKQTSPAIPLALILNNRRRVPASTAGGNETYAPFVNANYRANLRVTDFFPHKLEDFSVGRKPNEFDCLSDFDPTSDEEDDINTVGKDISDFVLRDNDHLQWSWRFALQVEDASPSESPTKERVWVLIDNESGQFLLTENAANLRTTPDVLAAVRERLFVLWGDLEERKAAYLNSAEGKILLPRSLESSSLSRDVSPPPKIPQKLISRPGEQPPDSDEEMPDDESPPQKAPAERDPNSLESIRKATPKQAATRLAAKLREIGDQAQNKPFPGCIREYGIKVKVEEPASDEENEDDEDDEDQSQRTEKPVVATKWERKFGLHGTIIV
ncbi:hypothetical protein VE01_01814 [Pseudogymnoascus verrucosus]|uniref:Protection of telomeres protein 1 n=1 Tax=Pseudogymnoascus verrucosus TaxID=342668 RepID=A0A1B8GW74_9PEZI|nr:uncharacterized protein VE01_01814 [Pseudogymnoascus verrucosus]OBU00080.2 hypothetical protein VE01_01814 [Pseudogymnoascus verrucosus]